MALREILAAFSIDLDDKELKEGDKLVESFMGTLKGVGAAIGAAFAVNAIKDFVGELVNQADALNDSAMALGVTTNELQEFQIAAGLGGSSAEAVTAALNRLQRTAADPKALKTLGIGLKEFEGLSTTQRFEEIAEGIAKIGDPAKQAEAASKFFGKGVSDLLPLLKEGKAGIEAMRAEFQELGGGFGPDFVEQAAAVKDEMDRLDTVWLSMKVALASSLLPTIRQGLTWFRELARTVIPIVKTFREWLSHTKLLQAGFAALAVRGVAFLSGKIGPLVALLRRLAVWAARSLLPFLLLEDAFVFLAGGDSLIGEVLRKIGHYMLLDGDAAERLRNWIIDVWDEVKGFVNDFADSPQKIADDWNVFLDALHADMEQLFGVEWAGFYQAMLDLVLFYLDAFTGGWDNFWAKMNAGGEGIILFFQIIWTEIKFAGLAAAAYLSDRFDALWNSIRSGAASVLEVLNKIPGVDVSATVKDLQVAQGGTAGADVAAQRDQARLSLAGQYDAIAARASAPAYAPQLTSTVNVTVQGSADASTAAKVGAAAASGTQKGMGKASAAHVATSPRPAG